MKFIYTAIIMCISVCMFMVKRAFENNLIRHELKLDIKMEKPLSILFISDIHRRKIPAQWFRSLPEADLILIGGDITEKGVPIRRVKNNAALLAEAGNAYFVFGNNDEEVNKEELTDILKSEGVTILENNAESLEGFGNLTIAGIGDINYLKDDVNLTLKDTGQKDVILLSHDPRVTRKLADAEHSDRVKLILCGHTHGGQIRIFGFGPYQKGSLIQHDHYTQLISNGYGTTLLPMRLGAKSEVHLLTISS